MAADVIVVADERELAERVADRFIASAREAIIARGTFAVALAGGSTPKAAFDLLAQAERASQVDWQFVRFAFGDERCVGPDHPDSNFGMARTHLFAPLGIAPEAIYRIHGEDEPYTAAANYETLLCEALGDPPIFDLIMLGMGPDGHTASLFPGTLGTFSPDRIVVANYVPKLDAYRITLTPETINAARAVEFATAGEAKAEALAMVFHGYHDPNIYPSQIVDPENGSLTWIIDRAAAARLEPPPE